ncbi:alanine racemase [Roseicyclus persicicus]|uniref:Alanine racemase n=1 Tax=Roseicyclus persicicus TaxID=2650661 RepID=A0A7X6K047_9RHOB|nr:alanine racemase [Roseibacterium persicicum]NKX45880.1 alanine racemase [Roseibacterium persicicum]
MGTGILTIDLDALAANWRDLARRSRGETGAVVKANGYGCGAAEVATRLAREGARRFFVATSEEGAALRGALGAGPEINVFSGHMAGDTALIRDHALTPMLNSPEQAARHRAALPGHPYGVQLDSGMNRLGMEAPDWAATRADLEAGPLTLVMSHLACADDPAHPMNAAQLRAFTAMSAGVTAPRSFAATGGILLGPDYHFDVTRPGVGIYGGQPFADARPVVRLSLPVVQVRDVAPGEIVGYSATFTADTPRRIATLSAGYADGLIRYMSNAAYLSAPHGKCRLAGRVSMDLLTVDVTDLPAVPDHLDILGPDQTVDQLAEVAGTIGYEILTSLGRRYQRLYLGA